MQIRYLEQPFSVFYSALQYISTISCTLSELFRTKYDKYDIYFILYHPMILNATVHRVFATLFSDIYESIKPSYHINFIIQSDVLK